jgi:hypothetical protein
MPEVIWQKPKNLKPPDEREFSFAGDHERFIDEQKIKTLSNVKIDAQGLLYRNFWPLVESFSNGTLPKIKRNRRWLIFDFNYPPKKFLANPFLLKNNFGKKKIIISEPALWFTDDWSNGFFHWFADAIPRLYFAREYWNKTTIILPEKFKKIDFTVSSLNILGVTNIRHIARNEIISVRELILPTQAALTGNFNGEIMKKLREVFRAYGLKNSSNFGDKIYISRASAKKRRIINEEELKPILVKYGFQIMEPEKFNFLEQLAIFSQTKYLISIHGAGLTNMLFMPEKSAVLELRVDRPQINNCYYALASALGLNYYYQKPAKEEITNSTNLLTITPEELKKNIKIMLNE